MEIIKAICIKNFTCDYHGFILSEIYSIEKVRDSCYVAHLTDGSGYGILFYTKNTKGKEDLKNCEHFYDFFMKLKDFREIKLKEILYEA